MFDTCVQGERATVFQEWQRPLVTQLIGLNQSKAFSALLRLQVTNPWWGLPHQDCSWLWRLWDEVYWGIASFTRAPGAKVSARSIVHFWGQTLPFKQVLKNKVGLDKCSKVRVSRIDRNTSHVRNISLKWTRCVIMVHSALVNTSFQLQKMLQHNIYEVSRMLDFLFGPWRQTYLIDIINDQ